MISHLSCSSARVRVCVSAPFRVGKRGGRGETDVLLLADCEYAEGYECAPEEGLAAGSLREAEEAPDVLTLCAGSGGERVSRRRESAGRGARQTDGVAPCFDSRVELRA